MADTGNEHFLNSILNDVFSFESITSPLTSTTSSEKVLEVIDAGSFNPPSRLADSFEDLACSTKSDCHNLVTFTQSRETAKTYTSEFESNKEVASSVPWWKKNNILTLDDCINVIVDASNPVKTDDFDKNISETIEKLELPSSPEKVKDEGFPYFDIPPLATIVPLPISDDLKEKVCFAEMLMVCTQDLDVEALEKSKAFSSDCCEPVGSTVIEIDKSVDEDGVDRFDIYSTSSFCNQDGTATAEMLGLVDTSCQCLNEKKVERLENKEKTLRIHKNKDGRYFISTKEVNNDCEQTKQGPLKLNVSGDLIPDSSHLLLMRYLVLIRYTGTFQTWTVDMNGDILRTIYTISNFQPMTVNGSCVDVKQVVRAFEGKHSTGSYSISYYVSTGHLVRHMWHDCKYCLMLNPLSKLLPEPLLTHNVADKEHDWEEDIQLFSQYLDYKHQRRQENKDYVNNHTELKDILKKYVHSLVRMQPTDVLDFSIQHFQNLPVEESSSHTSFFNGLEAIFDKYQVPNCLKSEME